MPNIGRYNPNYKAIDRNIKGNITMKPNIGTNTVMIKKKGLMKKYKRDARKKMNFKNNK